MQYGMQSGPQDRSIGHRKGDQLQMGTRVLALWDFRDLLQNLVSKDIRVRYMDAGLGFAWALVNPLILTLMYLVVFTVIFRPGMPNYALYLVTGILHWTLFSQVIAQSPELLVANAGLIRKIYFPHILIPLSNLFVNLILWLLALVVYLFLFPLMGGRFTPVLLVYPLFLLLFVGFSFGLSLILTTLYVPFRDIKHIVEVVLQVLIWSVPVLYPLSMAPRTLRHYMMLSPLVEFTEIFHDFFYNNRLPPAELTYGFLTWTIFVLGLGLWLFNRWVPRMVEDL